MEVMADLIEICFFLASRSFIWSRFVVYYVRDERF